MKSISRQAVSVLAISNFISAFGGGSILGKASGILSIFGISVGSIFAFFVGTILGLFLLDLIQKKFSESAPKWMSLLGGICSLILIAIFQLDQFDSNVISIFFLMVLCLRFCFWFLARIYRSNMASSNKNLLPIFEGSYVLGTICGILVFSFAGSGLSLLTILIVDLITQLISFLFDKKILIQEKLAKKNIKVSANKKMVLLISIFCLISIACQVSLFQISKLVPSGYLLIVVFYIGMFAATIISLKKTPTLNFSNSSVSLLISKSTQLPTVLVIGILILLCLLLVALLQQTSMLIFTLLLSFLLSTVYEILALGIVSEISKVASESSYPNGIAKSYSIMAISAAFAIFIFIVFDLSIFTILSVSICSLVISAIIFHILKNNHILSYNKN
ncbi:MAG: hypothetical protein AB8E15_13730 [Bdellovibrionales bacterium]